MNTGSLYIIIQFKTRTCGKMSSVPRKLLIYMKRVLGAGTWRGWKRVGSWKRNPAFPHPGNAMSFWRERRLISVGGEKREAVIFGCVRLGSSSSGPLVSVRQRHDRTFSSCKIPNPIGVFLIRVRRLRRHLCSGTVAQVSAKTGAFCKCSATDMLVLHVGVIQSLFLRTCLCSTRCIIAQGKCASQRSSVGEAEGLTSSGERLGALCGRRYFRRLLFSKSAACARRSWGFTTPILLPVHARGRAP